MKVQVIVDRLEGDLAVLEVEGDGIVEWPVKHLPPGVSEGNVLEVTISVNKAAEAKRRSEVSDLQRELLDRTKKMEGK